MKRERYVPLDSLRGLAAWLVVITHVLSVYPVLYGHSPSGHPAVVFFFVLSGFVLSLPFFRGPVAYGPYLLRRLCRIWLPYVAAMLLATVCAVGFYPQPVPELSQWANHAQRWPTGWEFIEHLMLVGSFPNGTYNPVVWSLVHEMRVSLFFPLLFWVVSRLTWIQSLALALSLSLLATALRHASEYFGVVTDYPLTLHYSALFIPGILLARHAPWLISLYARIPTWTRWLGFLGSVMLFTHSLWLWPGSVLQRIPVSADGLVALSVVYFITVALAPSRMSLILQHPWLVRFGQMSYSIYLCHAVILLSLVHSFWSPALLPWLLLLVFPLTFALSALAYAWVELPAIRLGSWLMAHWPFSPSTLIKLCSPLTR